MTAWRMTNVEGSSIGILTLAVLAMLGGCRREIPSTRSSVESSTSVVATTSGPDSQPSIASTAPTPSLGVPPIVNVDTAPSVHFASRKDSLCGEFAENGFLIPDTRRTAVAARLGQPDSVQSHVIPNTHRPAQTDTLVDTFYHGLRLHYIVLGVTQGETDILLQADVSDNRYLKYPALGVGARPAEIISALGEPEERRDDSYRYSCALHVMSGSTVYFYIEGDRIKYVEYRWDAD